MKTTILTIAALVVVLVIAIAIRATDQIKQGRATLVTLSPQRNELRKSVGQLEARLKTARGALVAGEQKSTTATAESGEAKPGANAGSAGTGAPATSVSPARRPNPRTIIANDPTKMAEYAKNFRTGLDCDYGGMFKALGLSPDQIEKFKDVEVSLEQARFDLQAAIDSQELDANSAEYRKLWDDYISTRGPKKAEVLGDLAGRYFEYYFTGNVRTYVQRLVAAGTFTGETVTSAQVERAADVLIANSKRRGPNVHGVEANTIDWAASSGQLKTILSPTQIEGLGLFIEADRVAAALRQRTNRLTAQFKAQPPPK